MAAAIRRNHGLADQFLKQQHYTGCGLIATFTFLIRL